MSRLLVPMFSGMNPTRFCCHCRQATNNWRFEMDGPCCLRCLSAYRAKTRRMVTVSELGELTVGDRIKQLQALDPTMLLSETLEGDTP